MGMVLEPWPPTDPTAPLPYDQRGSCWPLGPCSYRNRLQMRYDAVCVWSGGTPNPTWFPWGSGQSLILLESASSHSGITVRGLFRAGTASHDDVILAEHPTYDSGWEVRGSSIVSIAPPSGMAFSIDFPAQLCEGEIIIIPTTLSGPDPPDFLVLQPRRWYEPMFYPYYG